MDIKQLKELLKAFEGSNVAELNYKSVDGEEIYLNKYPASSVVQQTIPAMMAPVSTQLSHTDSEASEHSVKKDSKKLFHTINSPLVGTFYSSVKPGEKPFVEVGKRVSVGDVVCIIESMKIMNKIKSDKEGVVRSMLISDGSPVEFDEPLIEIE